MNKREIKRNKLANDVCKEVRYQLCKNGCISDNERLYDCLAKWLNVAKVDAFNRPEQEEV